LNASTIGFVAGTLTSLAAIPQVVKTVRSRHVRDISIWQPLLLSIGVALWMLYGIMIDDLPLIIANIIPLLCNLLLTGMKIVYGKRDESAQT
jgi:MtN3 and saliva related transmembrane protein